MNGRSAHEGRVEMCRNNEWGQICFIGWTNVDARVVCRQLGFSPSGKNQLEKKTFQYHYATSGAVTSNSDGQLSESELLGNVACTGEEERLVDCPSRIVTCRRYYWNPNTIAGVRCHLQTGWYFNSGLNHPPGQS